MKYWAGLHNDAATDDIRVCADNLLSLASLAGGANARGPSVGYPLPRDS
jgi:hypothetical protein